MKKVLLIADKQSHIAQFYKPLAKVLHAHDYEVHVAASNDLEGRKDINLDFIDKVFDVPFGESLFCSQNRKAKKVLKQIVNSDYYHFIHCFTFIGGVFGRKCARTCRKRGTKVFYTTLGFKFHNDAPLKHWLFYYPIESFYAHFTDKIIVINEEDKDISKAEFIKNTFFVHGTGINSTYFYVASKKIQAIIKNDLEMPKNRLLLFTEGELDENGNHIFAIKVVESLVKQGHDHVMLYIAGDGPLKSKLEKYVKDNFLDEYITFIGRTTIVGKYMQVCDVTIAPFSNEQFSNCALEAMLCGHLVFASSNRFHNEILKDHDTYQFYDKEYERVARLIIRYIDDPYSFDGRIAYNLEIATYYLSTNVEKELENIYFEEI